MKRMTKQENDLMNIMRTSTDPQEIIETAAKLGPEPWTMEEAEDLAEINKSDEPEKGFMELLLEALSTEDLTQKEAIYEKIVEQEIKRLQKESERRRIV